MEHVRQLFSADGKASPKGNSESNQKGVDLVGKYNGKRITGSRRPFYTRIADKQISLTDPDATPMRQSGGGRTVLGYRDHYVVDGCKARIILSTLVTPASIMDNTPMLDMIHWACANTSGSWSPYFVAHMSQLYRLPDTITDENAVLIEPFACGVHAALQNFPQDDETVLIIGAGTIGLCMVAALRGLGSQARLIVSARYPFQADAASKLGADHMIVADDESELFAKVSDLIGAEVKKPILGKEIMVGGADVTFECVGTQVAVDDALRLTCSGGRVAIAGAPGEMKKLDWTPLFFQELKVRGAYIFNHAERYDGKIKRTFDIAIELMASGKVDLGWMVTHRFALDDFKQALRLLGKKSQD